MRNQRGPISKTQSTAAWHPSLKNAGVGSFSHPRKVESLCRRRSVRPILGMHTQRRAPPTEAGWSGPHLPPRTSVARANARTGPDIRRGLFAPPTATIYEYQTARLSQNHSPVAVTPVAQIAGYRALVDSSSPSLRRRCSAVVTD